MSTPEMQLISRVVRGGQPEFTSIVRWGIHDEDFSTLEARGMWQHILGLNQLPGSKGSVPGINSIKDQFPHFILCDDEYMSTEILCKQVRDKRLILTLKIAAQNAIENADLGPLEAAAIIQKTLSHIMNLGSQRTTDVMFGSAFTEIMQDYNRIESGVITAKAPWPWPSLQEATGGLQEDDYVVFYGRPKSMKSWVLCHLISFFFLMDKKVLIYTKEMTPKNIYKRVAACLAAIPYQEFRKARLDIDERLRLLDAYSHVQTRNDLLICLSGQDVPAGGDTVSWYRSKAEHYKPDICSIDGFALMSSTRGDKAADWVRVMSISREISQMRLALQTPVIATCHANRKAAQHNRAELDEVAYSDAVGQDATLACRVINEKGRPTIALVIGGSREFELPGIRIGGIPATDFEEKEVMTSKEINKAAEGDTGEQDSAEAHAKTRRTPRTDKNHAEDADIAKIVDLHLRDL